MPDQNTDVSIKAKLQVDTGDSGPKVDSVKRSVKEAGAETSATGGLFNKLKGELSGVAGPAAQATGSLTGLNTVLNVLKANPIIGVFVLIASLVAALFSHFSKMEAVSDALGKAWANLSGIFEVFMNNILKPLIDGFVTLVGWISDAANFIVGLFSPSTAAAAKALGDLEEQMDNLNDTEAKNNLVRAESNRRLAEARDLAQDANLPIKDRIAALQEAGKIEKQTLEESIAINMERARIVLQQIAIELGVRQDLIDKIKEGSAAELKAARDEIYNLDEVDKEKIKKFDELIITADDKGAELAKVQKKTNTAIRSLEKEDEKEKEQARKEAYDKAKALHDKQVAERQKQIENQRAQDDKELKLRREIELNGMKDAQEKELTVLMNGYQDDLTANDNLLKQKKISLQDYYETRTLLYERFNQREAAITKKYEDEKAKKEAEEQKEKDKLAEQRKKEDQKKAEADAAILRKLTIDRLNFQISQNTKDLAETKKLLNAKQQALTAHFLFEMLSLKNSTAEKLAIEQKYKEDIAGITAARQSIKEAEVQHTANTVNAIGGLLGQASELAGKQTVAGKALAVASTTIATYQSAMGAFKGMVTSIPGPVGIALGVVAAALAAATGIANIKKIVSTKIPGQGDGGGSVPTPAAVTAPVLPQRTQTTLDSKSIQAVGNAANGGVYRSYVSNEEVNDKNEMTRRITRQARLG